MPQPDHLQTLKAITNSAGITLLVLDREKNQVSLEDLRHPGLDAQLPLLMRNVHLENFEILSRISQVPEVWHMIKKNDIKYPWDLTLQLFCKRTSYIECYIHRFETFACLWFLSRKSSDAELSKKKKRLLTNLFQLYGANLHAERQLTYEILKFNIQEKAHYTLTSTTFKNSEQKWLAAISFCMKSLNINECETLVYIDNVLALHHNNHRFSLSWQESMMPLLMNFIRSNTVVFESNVVYSIFKDELFDIIADERRFEIIISTGITRFDFIYTKEAGVFSFVFNAHFLKSTLRSEQKRILKDFWLQLIEKLQAENSRSSEINEDKLFHLLSSDLDITLSETSKITRKSRPNLVPDLPTPPFPDKQSNTRAFILHHDAGVANELNKFYKDLEPQAEPLPADDEINLMELLSEIRVESGEADNSVEPLKIGFNDTILYTFRSNKFHFKNTLQLLQEVAYNSASKLMHLECNPGEIRIFLNELDLSYLLPHTFTQADDKVTYEVRKRVFLHCLATMKELRADIYFSDTPEHTRRHNLEIRIKAETVGMGEKILITKLLMPGSSPEEVKSLETIFLVEKENQIPTLIRNNEMLIVDVNKDLGEKSGIFKRRTIFVDRENKLIRSSYHHTRYRDLEFDLLQIALKQWDTEPGKFGFRRILLPESLAKQNPSLTDSIKNFVPEVEIDIAGNEIALLEMAGKKRYDLIFIELQGSGMNGLTVVEELYKDEQYDPFILNAVILTTPKSWLKIEQKAPAKEPKRIVHTS